MKTIFTLVTTFLVYSLMTHQHVSKVQGIENPTTVQNNKFGIHILETSEVTKAQELVNSSGGDWGYITIPIQPTDRNKDKWQTFMHHCADAHLIPILRITTIPEGGTWQEGRDTDLVDFANFLGDLDWPVKNRYVIIFNEVNRSTEWGGKVDPAKYTRILKNARTIFKERSSDFFILPAGLDNALPTSNTSMRAQDYLRAMMNEDPAIWSYIDGWNSHSYPNPAFSASPYQKGWTSITSYQTEINFIQIAQKPVFITETGWVNTKLGEDKRASYLNTALKIWDQDPQVVAVTPFLLQAGAGDFVPFSYITQDGKPTASYQTLKDYPKKTGKPTLVEVSPKTNFSYNPNSQNSPDSSPIFRHPHALLKLENFFRKLFGLNRKSYLLVKNQMLEVELAETPSSWEQGLSSRDKLPLGTGMYFIFDQPHIPLFWMKDVNFPLDIIWIKGDKIIDFSLNVEVSKSPHLPTYSPKSPVDKALEVPAGFVELSNLAIGDTVKLIDTK